MDLRTLTLRSVYSIAVIGGSSRGLGLALKAALASQAFVEIVDERDLPVSEGIDLRKKVEAINIVLPPARKRFWGPRIPRFTGWRLPHPGYRLSPSLGSSKLWFWSGGRVSDSRFQSCLQLQSCSALRSTPLPLLMLQPDSNRSSVQFLRTTELEIALDAGHPWVSMPSSLRTPFIGRCLAMLNTNEIEYEVY